MLREVHGFVIREKGEKGIFLVFSVSTCEYAHKCTHTHSQMCLVNGNAVVMTVSWTTPM